MLSTQLSHRAQSPMAPAFVTVAKGILVRWGSYPLILALSITIMDIFIFFREDLGILFSKELMVKVIQQVQYI